MSKIKDFLRYVLWLSGFGSSILPKSRINKIIVLENNEPLICLEKTERLSFSSQNQTLTPLTRQTVAKMIYTASQILPSGYNLLLIEAYRSQEEQKRKWLKQYKVVRAENNGLSEGEIYRITRLSIAEPTGEGPHQTGGAVDVSLSRNGVELDMGTGWTDFNSKTPTKSLGLTPLQISNRKLLMSVMTQAEFVNYPGEWWHFSYGDRMWAAYSRKKTCFYGSIAKPSF